MTEKKTEYKGTIAVCTPMYGDVAHRTYINSVILLADALRINGYGMSLYTVGNESLISRARNTLVYQALKTKDLVGVLFLDADQGVDPLDVLSLIESEKEIIGGIVPKKYINWAQVRNAVLMKEEDLSLYSGQFAVSFLNDNSITITYNEPIEVRHIGTGLMYVAAEVFEKLKPECKIYKNGEVNDEIIEDGIVEFFTTHITEGTQELLSEDYTFCEKWRSLGGKVWAAPWIDSLHSGTYTFAGSFRHTVDMISRLDQISKSISSN